MATKCDIESSRRRKLILDETDDEPEIDPISKRRKTGISASEEVGNDVDQKQWNEQLKWCHHGHLTEKHRLLHCNICRSNKFCIACIAKWYPNVPEEQFVEACPVCCNNCNCKACLHGLSPKDIKRYSCSEPDKIQYSKYVIQNVVPFVKSLNEEQLIEKKFEAEIKGISVSELQLKDAECDIDEDIFCNNCGSYFFDLYRSCTCGYDLCLKCCRDLRDGQLQGLTCEWKACANGSIPCPPKEIGGCNDGILELKHIMPFNSFANMLQKAESINTSYNIPQTSEKCGMCYENGDEKCNAIYLYSLTAKNIKPEDMKHFQFHWAKGEPIIVNGVLSTSSGLSWEPMVMWRAFHDTTKSEDGSHAFEVNAVNCSDWSEVDLDLYKFFMGYLKGGPMVLKLEDWQPFFLSDEEWPRHFVELMKCLPFKDYTNPHDGYLNVVNKLPNLSLKPDLDPRMNIAYVDSFTKLRCDKADTVNVLTHTSSRKLNKKKIKKRKHGDQDEGGAMWDIFRREDIPKLQEYLKNHLTEFKHANCLSVGHVVNVHPMHDRTFYLNRKHKRKLKEEFGIKPWTFKQKLGDAVFIPAGCPYQIKNLKSSTKVEFNFVSPESLGECIHLQHELRMLPNKHRAKKEKLNIWKMIIYALEHALADQAGPTEILNGNDADNLNHNAADENLGAWQGFTVGPEIKRLLETVEQRYPNTFHGVQIRSKAIWIPILKQFHLVIKQFMETYVDALVEDRITTLHEDLDEFERLGFDLSWAHQRLNMVEKLKFGKEPLKQELMDLEECLESIKERLSERVKEFVEAHERLKKARLEYDNATNARNKMAHEVAQKFGVEYDHVLKGQLGFGIITKYDKV